MRENMKVREEKEKEFRKLYCKVEEKRNEYKHKNEKVLRKRPFNESG